jgi:predicted metal-dependent phosphoesterase TrpH
VVYGVFDLAAGGVEVGAMKAARMASWCLLAIALAAGTCSDAPHPHPLLVLGQYRVLAVDTHVHTFPFSASTLWPWDLVLEARRQGLDAIAITGHDQVLAGKMGRWFSRLVGGPTVLAGEEIVSPDYHLIAVGIENTISWRLRAGAAIDEVHRQGGIAIAAHPIAEFWPGWNAEAMRKLDGAEIVQPVIYTTEYARREMREFFARRRLTAIGASDYHGLGPVGLCRTYVFVREASEPGILQALREGHTVVYDRMGAVYGDPSLIQLAGPESRLRGPEPVGSESGFLVVLSRTCGLLGMIGLSLCAFRLRPMALVSARKTAP